MGNIIVRVVPHAEYKGKKIVKINDWYQVKGASGKFKTLSDATDSIK